MTLSRKRKILPTILALSLAASTALGACTFPGAVASVPEREEEVAAVATAVDAIPDYSMPTAPGFPTAVPTPAYILPSLESLVVNGTALIAEDDVFTVPAEINPGDRLQVEAEVADDVGGTLSALSSSRPYMPEGGAVEFSLTLPADLSSADIPLVLEGSDGERAEYALRITPSSEWAPTVVVENPTGLTGEVSLEVRVTDLNGSDTVQSLAVEQEFNPQATGNKRIREYISNTSLAPFTVEQTESGLYTVRFNAEWPGRFPLHLFAKDEDGNATEARVPVIISAEALIDWEFRGGNGSVPTFPGHLKDSRSFREGLEAAIEHNVTWIQIGTPYFITPNIRGTDIEPIYNGTCPGQASQPGHIGNTASDSAVVRAIKDAHEKELRVYLRPDLESCDFQWRGRAAPNDWSKWFEEYSEFILHYAQIAEENDVEMLSIGFELKSSLRHTDEWNQLIAQVREAYSGKIAYSVGGILFHGSPSQYTTEWFGSAWEGPETAAFLYNVDYIGIDWYAGLSGQMDPSVEEMQQNAERIIAHFVRPLYETYQKPIFIDEIDFENVDGINRDPLAFRNTCGRDDVEQQEAFEAVLRAFSDESYFEGMFPTGFYFTTPFNDRYGPCQEGTTNSLWFKPAAEVFRTWYADE